MAERWSVAPVVGGSSPLPRPKIKEKEIMILSTVEVMKIKSEIARLRKIAADLEPGTIRQELGKRADALGKKISLYSSAD